MTLDALKPEDIQKDCLSISTNIQIHHFIHISRNILIY